MSIDSFHHLLHTTPNMSHHNWLAVYFAMQYSHRSRYYYPAERAALFAAPAYGEVVWC